MSNRIRHRTLKVDDDVWKLMKMWCEKKKMSVSNMYDYLLKRIIDRYIINDGHRVLIEPEKTIDTSDMENVSLNDVYEDAKHKWEFMTEDKQYNPRSSL